MVEQRGERQRVPVRAEPGDHPEAHRADQRPVPERLAAVHVGEVDLDERYFDGQQGVAQCDTGVGKSRRIEDDEIGMSGRLLNVINQFGFRIALQRRERVAQLLRRRRSVSGFASAAPLTVGIPVIRSEFGTVGDSGGLLLRWYF